MNVVHKVFISVLLCMPVGGLGQQSSPPVGPAPGTAPNSTAAPSAAEGRIHLDVVVTNAAGNPVSGLEAKDFTLLDNGHPEQVASFRAFDGVAQKPEEPVEILLVLDTVNLGFQDVSFVRQEVEKYLRRNDGHLAHPVSLLILTDTGLKKLPRPSTDGNALAAVVDRKGAISMLGQGESINSMVARFQLSLSAISTIAADQEKRPGRKLLIWIGQGWPMLDGPTFGQLSTKTQQQYFDAIVSLSTKLREERMAFYSISPGSIEPSTYLYRSYLKAVKSAKEAYPPNLALKVLAVQSGGRILGPNSDLAGQIEGCFADADVFYTLSFDPPRAAGRNDYHELKVEIGKPGLTAHTNTGYYNQP